VRRRPKLSPRWGQLFLAPVLALVGFASWWSFTADASVGSQGPSVPLERRTCTGTPYKTRAVDASPAGEVLYLFIYDNVFRKNLAKGYQLGTPRLRSGDADHPEHEQLSREEWGLGDIPVPFEPIGVACTVGTEPKVNKIDVALLINGNVYVATLLHLGLVWKVDYFQPAPPKTRATPHP
jgi:hypothetical protein